MLRHRDVRAAFDAGPAALPRARRRPHARRSDARYLLDPDARTLEALELRDGRWVDAGTFDAEGAPARVPPFELIELPIGRLFLPRTEASDDGV